MKQNLILAGVIVLLIAMIVLIGRSSGGTLSGAPPGVPGTVATSSNPTVSTSGIVIIATSTCSARIITTVASPIMLTFSDFEGDVPTALFGHLQGASTTVSYDSGVYGCGLVKAYGFVSSAITVTDVR